MSWNLGFDDKWNRFIGYGVPAYCDHPSCNKEIDRGLSYVCGGEPYGGEEGCGLHFCEEHLHFYYTEDEELGSCNSPQLCQRCYDAKSKNKELILFTPKKEHPEWINHLLTDSSWEEWRQKNPDLVKKFKE